MFVRVHDLPGGPSGRRSRLEQRSYEIHRLPGGLFRLVLAGRLPRRWADPLCRGLARERLSIRRGFARLAPDGWHAELELARAAGSTDPLLVDYLALALRAPGDVALPSLALDRYRLARRGDGGLDLEVEGPDQLGFLGGLLERLAFLALVPEAMWLETGPAGLRDRFLLRRAAGGSPTEATLRILRDVLAGRVFANADAAAG
jgi:hypothetical protein